MIADATNTSKHMDCDRVRREEIVEKYLARTLNDEDREAFEAHYFDCARCFQELQTLESIRSELQRAGATRGPATRSYRLWTVAAGMAAVVVLAVAAALWMQTPASSGPGEQVASAPAIPAQLPETPRDAHGKGAEPERPLEVLARFEPPPYEPLVLRGTPDDAMAQFLKGMDRYGKADYAGAVAALRAAAALDPDAPNICFFLGISQLMLGQDEMAIDRLGRTIALGESAYLEDAHWYLAKAFLRRHDIARAQTELKTIAQLRGLRAAEAQRLLDDVTKLTVKPG